MASIDVPRTWTLLNDNLREQLKTSGSALLEITGMPGIGNEYTNLVAANAYTVDSYPSATMRLAYDPGATLSQEELEEITYGELSYMASIYVDQIDGAFKQNGDPQHVVSRGAAVEKYGDVSAVVIRYTRTNSRNVEFNVEIAMVFLGTHSIKMTLSYRTAEELFFRSQMRRIRESLVVGP